MDAIRLFGSVSFYDGSFAILFNDNPQRVTGPLSHAIIVIARRILVSISMLGAQILRQIAPH
jgi:hypothetical protein